MLNKKYSLKDFTQQDLSDVNPDEFSGVITRSCFFEAKLPEGLSCEFIKCNLDNVEPSKLENCTLISCTHCQLEEQNDRQDWIMKNGKPHKPKTPSLFDEYGIPKDPKFIPKEWQKVSTQKAIEAHAHRGKL